MALTPLESLLVFSTIILQQDQSVCRAADICCLVDHRLVMWKNNAVDLLIQEAER